MEVRVPSLLALFFFFKVPTFPHPSSFGTIPEVPVSVLVPTGSPVFPGVRGSRFRAEGDFYLFSLYARRNYRFKGIERRG